MLLRGGPLRELALCSLVLILSATETHAISLSAANAKLAPKLSVLENAYRPPARHRIIIGRNGRWCDPCGPGYRVFWWHPWNRRSLWNPFD
jgi:hypothetical protein